MSDKKKRVGHQHWIKKCIHGVEVSRCGCLVAGKRTTVVPCPPECEKA